MFHKVGLAQVQMAISGRVWSNRAEWENRRWRMGEAPFLAGDSYLALGKSFRKNPACLQYCSLRSCSVSRLVRDKDKVVLWPLCKGSV